MTDSFAKIAAEIELPEETWPITGHEGVHALQFVRRLALLLHEQAQTPGDEASVSPEYHALGDRGASEASGSPTPEPVAWRLQTVGGNHAYTDDPDWAARCQGRPLYAAPPALKPPPSVTDAEVDRDGLRVSIIETICEIVETTVEGDCVTGSSAEEAADAILALVAPPAPQPPPTVTEVEAAAAELAKMNHWPAGFRGFEPEARAALEAAARVRSEQAQVPATFFQEGQ